MAACKALFAVALLACAASALAQNKCEGLAPGAKYRYQFIYQLKDPKTVDTVTSLVMKWMKEDCPGALAYGQGGALTDSPDHYGVANVTAATMFADYAAWSDWASLDELKACHANGMKSGNKAKIHELSKKAFRIVYQPKFLNGAACTPITSNGPATVRYMLMYQLSKPDAATCTKAQALAGKIVTVLGTPVRGGAGCSATTDTKVFGSAGDNRTTTANFGAYIDYKSFNDMEAFLHSTNPAAPRKELRALASSAIRVAIALPGSYMTNAKPAPAAVKTPAKTAGRRL